MEVRVYGLVVQVLSRELDQLLDILRHALDPAIGVHLQQDPARGRDVMLDGLKVRADLWLAAIRGGRRLGQWGLCGGHVALLHRIVSAGDGVVVCGRAITGVYRGTLGTEHRQVALSLFQ